MTEKWSVLAVMRFVLATIVAMGHIAEHSAPSWLGWVAKFGAFEAILGFLLISGYSIGQSYHKQPEGFLGRRIRRLYPVYLFALAVCVVPSWVQGGAAAQEWSEVLVNALLLNQLLTKESLLGPAWSLALEFWLYCLAPWLMAQSVGRVRWLAWCSLACYLVYSMARPLLGLPYFAALGYGANLPLLGFAWVAGLRLSRVDAPARECWRDVALMFALHWLMTLGLALAYRFKKQALGLFVSDDLLPLLMRGSTLVIVLLVFWRWVVVRAIAGRRSQWMRWLGDVSYPLYLLHVPVMGLLVAQGWHSVVAIYGVAFVASALVYRLLDSYSRKRHLLAA